MNLTDLVWPKVDALSRDVPIVLPIAALEQHGRHMPVFTDSLLCGEVVRRAAEKLGDPPSEEFTTCCCFHRPWTKLNWCI